MLFINLSFKLTGSPSHSGFAPGRTPINDGWNPPVIIALENANWRIIVFHAWVLSAHEVAGTPLKGDPMMSSHGARGKRGEPAAPSCHRDTSPVTSHKVTPSVQALRSQTRANSEFPPAGQQNTANQAAALPGIQGGRPSRSIQWDAHRGKAASREEEERDLHSFFPLNSLQNHDLSVNGGEAWERVLEGGRGGSRPEKGT